jgi:hypothetical protein
MHHDPACAAVVIMLRRLKMYGMAQAVADNRDAAVLYADIGFHDAPMIDDQGIRDDEIDCRCARRLALPHAVADHFAAAETDFIAIRREIALDFDDEFGVGETQAITGGRTIQFRVRPA